MRSEELVKGDVIRYSRKAVLVDKVNERGVTIKMFLPHATLNRRGKGVTKVGYTIKIGKVEMLNLKP